MGRGAFLKAQFNAGELSPLLDGRVDLAKYQNGCSLLENFIPTIHGPVRRRPGTRFLQDVTVEGSSLDPVLVPFVYNREQAYVLAFCDGGIRVYSDRGWVETELGEPYMFSPASYHLEPPRRADGTSKLSYAQSGDVLYIADGERPLQKISRLADDNWTIEYVNLSPPPMELFDSPTDPEEVEKREMYIWWDSATSVWNAHIYFDKSNTFAKQFGGVLVWEDDGSTDDSVQRTWPLPSAPAVGIFVVVDGRWYQVMAVSGSHHAYMKKIPTHTLGTKKITEWVQLDGVWYSSSITLRAVGNGRFYWDIVETNIAAPNLSGWTGKKMAKIRLRESPTMPIESYMKTFYAVVQTDSMTTRSYGFETIGTVNKPDISPPLVSRAPFPEAVGFFRDRLVMAAREKIVFSAPGDYENFSLIDQNGEVTADTGISVQISKGDIASISWLVSTDVLVLGTMSSEWVISEQTNNDPFGPENIKLEQFGATGSSAVFPVRVDDDVLYLSRTRSQLRRLGWSGERESYVSSDLSVLAEHLGRVPLREMAFQRSPSSVLWVANDSGDLLGFTYDREQDVLAWHRHDVGGLVLAVCCIPSPDGSRDDLWMVVDREVDGDHRLYMEILADDQPFGGAISDAFYLDCGATYSGAPATTISGLDHLEGLTVSVLADGATHPDRVVSGGQITLTRSALKVHVGLHNSARLRTMRVEAVADDGVAQGKTKRIHRVTARVIESVGLMLGPSWDKLVQVEFRNAAVPMDSPVPPFTGDKASAFPGGYDDDGYLCVAQEQPLPLTVVALISELQVNSR